MIFLVKIPNYVNVTMKLILSTWEKSKSSTNLISETVTTASEARAVVQRVDLRRAEISTVVTDGHRVVLNGST